MAAKPKPAAKRHNLTEVQLGEISLVDRPANPGARLHLFKRDNGEADTAAAIDAVLKDAQSFNDIWNATDIEEEWWKLSSALRNSISSILSDSAVTDKKSAIRTSIDQFKAAVIGEVDEASAEIGKGQDMSTNNDASKVETVSKADHDKVLADLAKAQADLAIAGLPADHRAHFDGLGEAAKADFLKADASKRGELVKAATALPESVAKQMEDLAKSNADLKARLDAKEAAEKDTAALAKAKEILGENGGDAEALSTVIKGLDAAGVETLAKQFAARDAVNKFASGKSPFAAVGKTATSQGNGAAATFDGKVSELRKSDPKLTVEQAQLRVLETNPELYEQMEAH